jgi:hypothetical protein
MPAINNPCIIFFIPALQVFNYNKNYQNGMLVFRTSKNVSKRDPEIGQTKGCCCGGRL